MIKKKLLDEIENLKLNNINNNKSYQQQIQELNNKMNKYVLFSKKKKNNVKICKLNMTIY